MAAEVTGITSESDAKIACSKRLSCHIQREQVGFDTKVSLLVMVLGGHRNIPSIYPKKSSPSSKE